MPASRPLRALDTMEAHTRTIAKLIEQAEHFIDHHDWDEAAVRCYKILALDPVNTNAQNKLRLIYLQHDLVEDMRNAVQRLSDPDDASPHQYRRRLAFSYRVLSRWEGWLEDDQEQTPVDDLEEVAQILNAAYLHGDDRDLLQAWNGYVEACAKYPRERQAVQWWMAKQYAQRGFFADAAEVLTEMLGRSPDSPDARYVLAEMRWWRDHADCIAWLV
jgi:tetratricopeptide (TPR) repeat protein